MKRLNKAPFIEIARGNDLIAERHAKAISGGLEYDAEVVKVHVGLTSIRNAGFSLPAPPLRTVVLMQQPMIGEVGGLADGVRSTQELGAAYWCHADSVQEAPPEARPRWHAIHDGDIGLAPVDVVKATEVSTFNWKLGLSSMKVKSRVASQATP